MAALAFRAERVHAGKSHAEKNRVEILLQVGERKIAAERLAVLDRDAADREDEIHLALRELVDRLVGGDAVFVEPARLLARVEDRDVVAVHREAMRAGEARRPGADDGDALSGRRGAAERMLAALHQMIGRVALQLADLDRLVLGEVPDARLLAERLHRADAGADAAHDVGIEDGLAGAAGIVGLDLADEERDVDMRRAGVHARRVEAEIAAVGFDEGLVARQRRMQVGKIARVVLGLQPPGGDVRAARHTRNRVIPTSPRQRGCSPAAKDEPALRCGQIFYQTVNFRPSLGRAGIAGYMSPPVATDRIARPRQDRGIRWKHPDVERRLAAILAADVVGYSRLMEVDETGTLARLKTLGWS